MRHFSLRTLSLLRRACSVSAGKPDPLGRAHGQAGNVLVIAMVFIGIFIVMGVGFYWLVTSQTRSTELERTELKAFNVAEAGVDAGMLALKLAWPEQDAESVSVDESLLKTALQNANHGLWDPVRSSPSEFLEITVYDNSDAFGNTITVPPENPADRVYYDANDDDKMFIDASANVDDDRHRILILAERHHWDIVFPADLALWANVVDSNGQGLSVSIESGTPPIHYDVHDILHKGINPGPGAYPTDNPTTWDSIFPPALSISLKAAARSQGTYFTSAAQANAFLTSGDAGGSVVYLESSSAVTIASSIQIGTPEEPVVVVIDTPEGSENGWDLRGTADFYGVVVVLGDSELRGTCGIHGALYTQGTVLNKGTGASGEINYNEQCLLNIRAQHTMSVNIVPNTWEEYTIPRTVTTVASP